MTRSAEMEKINQIQRRNAGSSSHGRNNMNTAANPGRKSAEHIRRMPENRLPQNRKGNGAVVSARPKIRLTENVETVHRAPRTQIPVGTIFFTVIATLLLMFMVYMSVQINEYTASVSSLNTKISQLQTKQKNLASEVIKKDDLVYIEEYATKELGMVKEENLPKKYISVGSEDKAEIIQKDAETNGYGSLSTLLSAIGENLQAFLAYMKD